MGRWYRQPDRSYRADPEEVAFGLESAEPEAALVGRDGRIVRRQHLSCWVPGEEVAAFDLKTGKRLDAWSEPLAPGQRYALLIAGDLEAQPLDRSVPCGSMRLVELRGDRLADWQVTFDGEPLWWPVVANAPTKPDCRVYVNQGRHRPGDATVTLRLTIRHRADQEVRHVRGGVVQGSFRRWADDRTEVEFVKTEVDFVPDGDDPRRVTSVTVVLAGPGGRAVYRQRLEDVKRPAAYRTVEDWRPFRSGEEVDLGKISQEVRAIHIGLPPGNSRDPDRWAVMEGPMLLGWMDAASSLARAGGWGAPLRLRHDPLAPPHDEEVRLSEAVIDHGIVRSAALDGQPRWLRLELLYPVEPGEGHRVVLIDRRRRVHAITAERIEEDGCCWWIDPGDADHFVAVAVAFEGERLGAWWDRDWARSLFGSDVDATQAAHRAAAVRWFKLPLFAPAVEQLTRDFVGRFPAACLRAWVCDREWEAGTDEFGEPIALRQPEPNEAWWAVLRSLFAGVPIDAAAAAEIDELTQAGGCDTATDELARCRFGPLAHRLRHLPIVMARVLDSRTVGDARHRRAAIEPLVEALRPLLPAKPPDECEESWERRRDEGRLIPDRSVRAGFARLAVALVQDHAVGDSDRDRSTFALGEELFRLELTVTLLQQLIEHRDRRHVPT